MPHLYVIADWNERYEVRQSRQVGTLTWVAIPNGAQHSREELQLRQLLARPRNEGAQIYAAWQLLVRLASRNPREIRITGRLCDSAGHPYTPADLAWATGAPQEWFEAAFTILVLPEFGWLRRNDGPGEDDLFHAAPNAPKAPKPPATSQSDDSTSPSSRQQMAPTGRDRTRKDRTGQYSSTNTKSGKSISPSSSDSDSPARNVPARTPAQPPAAAHPTDPSTARLKARFRWMSAVGRLWAAAADRPQHLADRTSTEALFERTIWPDDIAPARGQRRCDTAMNLVKRAAVNGENPMAWLTRMVQRELGVAP